MEAPVRTTWMVLALVACGEKDDSSTADDSSSGDDSESTDDSEGTDDSTPEELESTAAGNIDLRDGTLTALVEIQQAFSFYSDSRTFVYAVSHPDTTCADVAEFFTRDGAPFDRARLFRDGYCNLSITLQGAPELPTYNLQEDSGAVVTASCPYGEGEWAYDGSASFPDYYWTGEYYEAAAWKGTFSVTVPDSSTKTVQSEVDLREWDGSFPYESERPGEYKASGKLQGRIVATRCEGLELTGWF